LAREEAETAPVNEKRGGRERFSGFHNFATNNAHKETCLVRSNQDRKDGQSGEKGGEKSRDSSAFEKEGRHRTTKGWGKKRSKQIFVRVRSQMRGGKRGNRWW